MALSSPFRWPSPYTNAANLDPAGPANAVNIGNSSGYANSPYIVGAEHELIKKMKEWELMHGNTTRIEDEGFRMKAIAMRLRLREGEKLPFEHLTTAHSGEKVFAFLIVKGQPVVLEDESVMFPSDTFMTQLRMLMD